MHTRLRTASALVVGSGALLALGSLLPWTAWDSGYGTITSYGLTAGGASTLAIGLVVLALAVPIAHSSPRASWPIGARCLFLVALPVPSTTSPQSPHPL